MSLPLVSVILPVHDGVAVSLFDKSVSSILTQTFTNLELVVLLDGVQSSELNTSAQRWAQTDSRVRLLSSPSQCGIAGSLNTLIGQSRGEFVARMDADDVSMEDRLRVQVDFLLEHPEVGVVGTWAYEVDKFGTIQFEKKMPAESLEINRFMAKRDPLIHPTAMFRRSFFEDVGLYNSDPAYSYIEDTELWARALASKKQLANIAGFHYKFLMTEGTFTVGRRRGFQYAAREAGLRFRHCRNTALPISCYFWPVAVFAARLLPGWALRALYQLR